MLLIYIIRKLSSKNRFSKIQTLLDGTSLLRKEEVLQRTYDWKHNYLKERLNNYYKQLKFYLTEKNTIKFKEVYNLSQISYLDCKDLLVSACAYDSEGIARFLIEKGHDVNYSDLSSKNTPLHYALNNKNFALANLLLSKGAIEAKSNYEDQNPWQLFHSKYGYLSRIKSDIN